MTPNSGDGVNYTRAEGGEDGNDGVRAVDGAQAAEQLREATRRDGHCPECRALHPQHHAGCTRGVMVGPISHVGESKFEGWFASYDPAGKGDKQRARDAYAAGLGEQAAHLSGVKEDGRG